LEPSPLDDAKLKIQYLKANFIGLAMIGSVFLYAGVVEVLKRTMAPFVGFATTMIPAQVLTLKYVFVALGIGDFFLIKFMQKILGARSVAQLMSAAIVTFALSEAVAIFGLVLFLLAGQATDFYTFMFLSLFYFWFFFPKYKDWEAQLAAQPAKSATDM
jgi:F0F1-type ATP synthase membrane subunit c/vacuolar-type H+-ATPase subunit K